MIEWEEAIQTARVKIKTWDQMASEGEIDYAGDILLPSGEAFVATMEERLPEDRIINIADTRWGDSQWEDSQNVYWTISDDMIEEILEKEVEYETYIYPWYIFYTPQTRELKIGCEEHPLDDWKEWTPEDVRYMSFRAGRWWRENKEDLLDSIEQLELKPDKLKD